MMQSEMSEISQIKQFFNNQTVFLTGGTGFLGKVLIEKMLRECEEIKKIFVLVRTKRGKSPEERFNEIFDYACFDRLKAENPDALKKVSLINGDCTQPQLGLIKKDIEVLNQETTCIIHAAANVKFDQSVKEATSNIKATRDLLEMSTSMPNLKVFVYVSTAFSNCLYPHIEEKTYEPPIKAEDLISVVNSLDDGMLEAITPQLLGKWPNTYVYGKSITEDLVDSYREKLPLIIFRPAIVTSSVSEPVPGWADNLYGIIGVVTMAALGILRSLHAKLDAFAALVPVDYVSNCVLAAAWKRSLSNDLLVYNFVGPQKNRFTWGEFMAHIEPQCWKAASEKIVWYYCFKVRENETMHKIALFFLHTIPAYIADFFLFCCGRPRIAVTGYRKLNKLLGLLSYFSTKHWEFESDNVVELWSGMNDEDKKLFPFDMETMDWDHYGYTAVFGARLHLLKDTPDTIEKGKRKIKIMCVIHYTVLAILWYLLYKIVMFVFGLIF